MIQIADLKFEVESAELVGTLCTQGNLFWAIRVIGIPRTPEGLNHEWRPHFAIEELPAKNSVSSWQELLPIRISWGRSEDFEDASFSLESSYSIFEAECNLELLGNRVRLCWHGTTEVNRDGYNADVPFIIESDGFHNRIESLVSDEQHARVLLREHIADSAYSFTANAGRQWFLLKSEFSRPYR